MKEEISKPFKASVDMSSKLEDAILDLIAAGGVDSDYLTIEEAELIVKMRVAIGEEKYGMTTDPESRKNMVANLLNKRIDRVALNKHGGISHLWE